MIFAYIKQGDRHDPLVYRHDPLVYRHDPLVYRHDPLVYRHLFFIKNSK